jgi:hypothetical protein
MDQGAKQQIVDRVKQAENILVTVSANPSVDQLAACIGLTLLLNKMGKSATAVFSGKVPSTIEFLQPEKTLETTTDSLRDFIISLDKSKADKLRYKVEDNVVRIFITPYKAKLSEKDLVFSEGDFNVEVVMALGVVDRTHLDGAITAHGRILHDATVIAISAGAGKAPDIGQINWQDPSASSLSEMLVSVSEAFGPNLIDNQTATAFLTGIVAETERFSNEKTSPKVMTMSAQLMAAGANQQLVISKLEPPPPPPPPPPPIPKEPAPLPKPEPPAKQPEPPKPKKESPQDKPKEKGTLSVAHETSESDGDEVEVNSKEIHIDKQGNLQVLEEERKAGEASVHDEPAETLPPPPKPEPKVPVEPPLPSIAIPPLPPPPSPVKPPTPPAPVLFNLPPVSSPSPPPPPPEEFKLPPPGPTPEIKPDHHSLAMPSPTQPAMAASPLPPVDNGEEKHHAIMDPRNGGPSLGGAFTADTSQQTGFSSSYNDYNNTPVDPLNAPSPQGSNNIPPATQNPSTNVDHARSAVEQAFASAPFNPDLQPAAALGAQPMGSELHSPEANGTPSLNLPADANAPITSNPPSQPPPIAPPLPPPMPPPILPSS